MNLKEFLATPMDEVEAVDALDSILASDDPESAHSLADRVLLASVPVTVREAYARVVERAPWWTYA